MGRTRRIVPLITLAAAALACTSEEAPSTGGAGGAVGTESTASVEGGTPAEVGGWTAVPILEGVRRDTAAVFHPLNSIVTGVHFTDLEHGVIALHGDSQTSSDGGALQYLDAPDHVAGTALEGAGAGLDGQNESWVGLSDTPLGLIAFGTFGQQLYLSTDAGRTFTTSTTSAAQVPNARSYWLDADSAGAWHLMDSIGNVWISPTPPGPEATWTRTWQPEASPPQPDPVPEGACTFSFHQGYFAFDAQQSFWVSSDGQTMMYGSGLDSGPSGVCRSTDGGLTFVPVAFPDPPGEGDDIPYVIVFADDAHGIAARANDTQDGAAYVYTTSDGGATWTAGDLPDVFDEPGVRAALVSGFCAPGQIDRCWLVGFKGTDSQGVLLRTDDGGATWTDLSAGLAPFMDTYFYLKLHTGFALDTEHIWIGGARGALLYSDRGGE